MWVYLLLLIVVFVLLIYSIIFVVKNTHKFITKFVNKNVLSCFLSFIPILMFGIGLYIDTVNAIVVDLHLIILIALSKLVIHIIKRISKKDIPSYLSIVVGTLLTVLILFIAHNNAYNVKETYYKVYTNKDIENFRIVAISDSHLGTTMSGKDFNKYVEKINKLNPDIVVVLGDFIDDNTKDQDIIDGAKSLRNLSTKYGVYFIYGNHDKGYYSKEERSKIIKQELESNYIGILEDSYTEVANNIVLVGRKDKEDKTRLDASKLTSEIDKNKYIIILDHQPNDYNNEVKSQADLVLSGHTHGGQLIPIGFFSKLLGANDKVYGVEKRDNTTFIVSSGISDWAIKFKTGTISEYVVIDVESQL